MRLSAEAAHAIYDVLVQVCGAYEGDRDNFVYSQTNEHICEWRFMGCLGMGGKFWRNMASWYVNTYPEAMNVERAFVIDEANERLEELYKKYQGRK